MSVLEVPELKCACALSSGLNARDQITGVVKTTMEGGEVLHSLFRIQFVACMSKPKRDESAAGA